MKSNVFSSSPWKLLKPDVYSKRRYRRYSNELWSHWMKEYLESLEKGQKWTIRKKIFKADDFVVLKNAMFQECNGQWGESLMLTMIKRI